MIMMGCLLFSCFTISKHSKKHKHHHRLTFNSSLICTSTKDTNKGALQVKATVKQEWTKCSIDPNTVGTKEKSEIAEQCKDKRKVTFDASVKTYEPTISKEEKEDPITNPKVENKEEKQEPLGASKLEIELSTSSFPGNHRYRYFVSDEDEELMLNDNVSDGFGNNKTFVVEEESESLFSLSIDSRKYVHELEVEDKEVTSPMPKCGLGVTYDINEEDKWLDMKRNTSNDAESLLKPVANLPQHKPVVRAKANFTSLDDQDKENNVNVAEHLGLFSSPDGKMAMDREIAVDTSLSSWLVGQGATPISKSSDISVVKEFEREQVPMSSSPSPGPGAGTIESYWIHTGQSVKLS